MIGPIAPKTVRQVGLPSPARPSGVRYEGPRPARSPAPEHRPVLGSNPWRHPATGSHGLVKMTPKSTRLIGGG